MITKMSLTSTAIKEVEYDSETQRLTLMMPLRGIAKDGSVTKGYIFRNVPQDIFDQLCAAESAGSFLMENILFNKLYRLEAVD